MMVKAKKSLGIILVMTLMLSILFSYSPSKAFAKTIIPDVKFVTAPITEYNVGDRVKFDISAPNYGGRVEYRVVLWNNNTKTYSDLWNASNGNPSRYYKKWQPYGNNVFTLGWPINEPGNYRITVYVKRVGIANNKAALPSANCDDYIESIAFTVKAKEVAFDTVGKTYGSTDVAKPEKYTNSIKITANNVTFSNAEVTGDIIVTGDNVVLNNISSSGKITIDPGKDGNATLDNVKAAKIDVLSGGEHTIKLISVDCEDMNVSSTSTVRVEVSGHSEIVSTTASGYVIFDRKSGTFGEIVITKDEKGETVVEFRGIFEDKVVAETNATLKTSEGSQVKNLVVAPKGTDKNVGVQGNFGDIEVQNQATLTVNQGSTVNNLDVKAQAQVIVKQGSTVNTIDTNNQKVVVENNGTIGNFENTGSQESGNPVVVNPGNDTILRGVKLNISTIALKVGDTYQLAPLFNPATATNKNVTWKSSNEAVATVSATGTVTAVAEGNAEITVKTQEGEYTATAKIIVGANYLVSRIETTFDGIMLSLTSKLTSDVATIKIVDSNGQIRYIGQEAINGGEVKVTIPLSAGTYTCYVKGLEDITITELNFTK